jgi:lipopolysaccharide/colanic/teichoic acid biosynthesis glycosyltransferase
VHLKSESRKVKALKKIGSIAKRIFDIIFSIFVLLLLSPFLVIIAVGIRLDSSGPIFFGGERVGIEGKPFNILKFRTMYENLETYNGPKITAQGDERITPLGKWLRETKINELPQFWNVLIGEMSLVGPRPEDPDFVEKWDEDARREILSVRPGITSPASILYHSEEAMLNSGSLIETYQDKIMPDKIRLDQLYVRNNSPLLDIDVLFWTCVVLIPRMGSFEPPEQLLFIGPFSRFINRYMSWFFVDFIITLTSFGVMGVIWRSIDEMNLGFANAIFLAFGFSLLFSVIGWLFGVQRISWENAVFSDVIDLVPPTLVGGISVLLINYTFSLFPPTLILQSSFIAGIGFVIFRFRRQMISGLPTKGKLFQRGAKRVLERVLIIGGGEAGQFAAWILEHSSVASAFHVIGFIDDDMFKQKVRLRGVNVLGRRRDIPNLVETLDIGVIVFAIHNISKEERTEIINICKHTSAQFLALPDFLEPFKKFTYE